MSVNFTVEPTEKIIPTKFRVTQPDNAMRIGFESVQVVGGNVDSAVLYTPQNLSQDEQDQARENIGAASQDQIADLETAIHNGFAKANIDIAEAKRIAESAAETIATQVAELTALKEDGGVGYTEKDKIIIYPEITTEPIPAAYAILARLWEHASVDDVPLLAGKEYVVMYDGKPYECIFGGDPVLGIAYMGGIYDPMLEEALEGDTSWANPDAPFLIIAKTDSETGAVTLGLYSPPAEPYVHTVSIYEETETTHPIDPKFIPWSSAPGGGGGLPVVEFEALPNPTPEELGENDVAKMDALVANNIENFFARFDVMGMRLLVPMTLNDDEGAPACIGIYINSFVAIAKSPDDGKWMCSIFTS